MVSTGILCFISAAIIFVGFYALYSKESASEVSERDGKIDDRRLLAWSFSQFFVLAALVVQQQGFCSFAPGFRTDPIVYLSVLRYCHFAVILSTLSQ